MRKRGKCIRCGEEGIVLIAKGLCNKCYHYYANQRARERLRKKNLCYDCGKPAKVEKCKKCGHIVKIFSRCEKCLNKMNEKRIK